MHIAIVNWSPLPGIIPYQHTARLRFSKAELSTLRRACEILEAADTACTEYMSQQPDAPDYDGGGSLTDYGWEGLGDSLQTGHVRQLLDDYVDSVSGVEGVYIGDVQQNSQPTKGASQ